MSADVLQRIGDKWAVMVIISLVDGALRFSELQRALPGVSERMLSLTLRGLERDGMITRTVTPGVPPRVDYALAPLGLSLCEPVKALGAWAQAHHPEVSRARESYDARMPASSAAGTATAASETAASAGI